MSFDFSQSKLGNVVAFAFNVCSDSHFGILECLYLQYLICPDTIVNMKHYMLNYRR